MANNGNLIKPTKDRTPEERRESARKAGKASGKARREKAEFRKRFQQAMALDADPKVAATLSKTGVPVESNYDVLIAGIFKGVVKSNPAMVKEALKLAGWDDAEKRQNEMHEIQKAKAALEAERVTLENERQRLWLEAVKAQQGQGEELPDDGFLDALKGSSVEDWTDGDI